MPSPHRSFLILVFALLPAGCALDFETTPIEAVDGDVEDVLDIDMASDAAADVPPSDMTPDSNNLCGGTCVDTQCCEGDDNVLRCVNTSTDREHCGVCGNVCGPGLACIDGVCGCVEGSADCDGDPGNGCETFVSANPIHCGVCNNTCATNASCQAGMCTCPTGEVYCRDAEDQNATCRDASSVNQCGLTCETLADCDAGPRLVSAMCIDQVCVLECDMVDNDDYGDCDLDPGNGCETNLDEDPNNCGSCGNVCVPPGVELHGSSNGCFSGWFSVGCSYDCEPGWANCDGSVPGCETPTHDEPNCGGCGAICAEVSNVRPGGVCVPGTGPGDPGVCDITCQSGYGDCDNNPSDGCEYNLNTSTAHCGTCNNACPSGQTCTNGSCG